MSTNSTYNRHSRAGEYRKVKNGAHPIFVTVLEQDPLLVITIRPGNLNWLDEAKFGMCTEDFVQRINECGYFTVLFN